jgi:hypothetical protein
MEDERSVILDHFPLGLSERFELEERVYSQHPVPWHKPRGFWVSVRGEDDWPNWCVSESFRTETLANRYEVKLREDANVLTLVGIQAVLEFNAEYSEAVAPGVKAEYINWGRVSGNYDGIIIAPYLWPLRNSMQCFWYYSWDVASGCIWNLDAIESVAPAFDVPLSVSSYEQDAEKAEKL